MDIDIYVIKSEHLKKRCNMLSSTLDLIYNMMTKYNYKVKIINVLTPTIQDIENNLGEYDKKINLNNDEITDPDFKAAQVKFNLAQLSNLHKHIHAYEIIKKSTTKHNFIIEDDIILLEDHKNNFDDFLKSLHSFDYDVLLTCLAMNEDNKSKINIIPIKNYFKILLTKNSYFITPSTAEKLSEYMNVIRFPMKLSLSKFLFDNKDTLKLYILNKHTIFEGSKLGLFPTSVNTNNYLLQNNSYITLATMYNNNEQDLNKVYKHYMDFGKDNPDFLHILGLLYYKNKRYKEAIDFLKLAVINFKKNDGYMVQYNETINNCINIHQLYQDDIKDCFNKKGLY
jgi:GR25 family glycosyltransferase involved in LPS biosynthesis